MGAIASGARKKLSPLRHHQFDDQQRVWGAPKLVMVMSSHREVDWTSGLKLQASPSLFLLWYWDVIGWYWDGTSAVEPVESPLLPMPSYALPQHQQLIAATLYTYDVKLENCIWKIAPFISFYIHLYAVISKAIMTGPPVFGYPYVWSVTISGWSLWFSRDWRIFPGAAPNFPWYTVYTL